MPLQPVGASWSTEGAVTHRNTLTSTIVQRTRIAHDVVDLLLDAVSDSLLAAVRGHDRFSWTGLFTLDMVHRPARPGRNPGTGEAIQIPRG